MYFLHNQDLHSVTKYVHIDQTLPTATIGVFSSKISCSRQNNLNDQIIVYHRQNGLLLLHWELQLLLLNARARADSLWTQLQQIMWFNWKTLWKNQYVSGESTAKTFIVGGCAGVYFHDFPLGKSFLLASPIAQHLYMLQDRVSHF